MVSYDYDYNHNHNITVNRGLSISEFTSLIRSFIFYNILTQLSKQNFSASKKSEPNHFEIKVTFYCKNICQHRRKTSIYQNNAMVTLLGLAKSISNFCCQAEQLQVAPERLSVTSLFGLDLTELT